MLRCCDLLRYLLPAFAISLASCATWLPAPQQSPQPRLSDLATPRPDAESAEDPTESKTINVLYVYRFALPVEADLTESLSVLNTTSLPPQSVKRFQDNGLIVGMIDMDGYKHLLENLPSVETVAVDHDRDTPQQSSPGSSTQNNVNDSAMPAIVDARVYRLTGYDRLIPLQVTPTVKKAFTVDLLLDDTNKHSYTLSRGRCRFLVQLSSLPTGQHNLDIILQHHQPKHSLIPRTPEQIMLDGQVFDQLKINASPDSDRFLVMAVNIPRPEIEPPADDTQSVTGQPQQPSPEQPQQPTEPSPEHPAEQPTDDSQPQGEIIDLRPAKPPVVVPARSFGSHWLCTRRGDHIIQMLLIFQVQTQPL